MINYKIIENKLRKIIENNLIEKDDKILIAFSILNLYFKSSTSAIPASISFKTSKCLFLIPTLNSICSI